MLTSVTCQVEPDSIQVSTDVYWIGSMVLGCFASYSQLFTRYRWSQMPPKVERNLMEGGEIKKQSHVPSNCGKDPNGGQVVNE